MNRTANPVAFGRLLAACLLLSGSGCHRDEASGVALSPKDAAGQLNRAFAGASSETRQAAEQAADALRRGDFEQAVVSLTVVRAAPQITLDQGLAVHASTVLMESQLVSAAESGDEKARRAYALLKAMKTK